MQDGAFLQQYVHVHLSMYIHLDVQLSPCRAHESADPTEYKAMRKILGPSSACTNGGVAFGFLIVIEVILL